MTQPPFHISYVAMMLFGFSAMLDTGKHDNISLDEVKAHVDTGDLIQFLYKKAGYKFDQGICESNPEFARWFIGKLDDNCKAMQGRERKKYGIEKRGLCLLISYTAEILQKGDDILLERAA